jgi:hypothetical protein
MPPHQRRLGTIILGNRGPVHHAVSALLAARPAKWEGMKWEGMGRNVNDYQAPVTFAQFSGVKITCA